MRPFLYLAGLPLMAATLMLASPASATLAPVQGTGDVRISGIDRFATSAEISKSIASPPQATVFVASAEAFPDALAAGPVAAAAGAPILLVDRDTVAASVTAEIERLSPDEIVIVGGEASVSQSVANQLASLPGRPVVRRIAGATRYDTAAQLLGDITHASELFVVSGEGFADALAAGPAAAHRSSPILLTGPTTLPLASVVMLQRLNPSKVTVVGGPATVTDSVLTQIRDTVPAARVDRVSGNTRYATAAELVRTVWPTGATSVFLASGTRFPDALAGTPAASVSGAPVLLTTADCHPTETMTAVEGLNSSLRVHLGGPLSTYMGDRVCGQPDVQGEAGGYIKLNGMLIGRDDASSVTALEAALGAPDERVDQAMCYNGSLQNTLYRWGDLEVTVLQEEDSGYDYGFAFPPGSVAGWVIDPALDGTPGLSLHMTGPEGTTIGTSLATLQQRFTLDDWDFVGVEGGVFIIFVGDTMGAEFTLDADQQVSSMSGGGYNC